MRTYMNSSPMVKMNWAYIGSSNSRKAQGDLCRPRLFCKEFSKKLAHK